MKLTLAATLAALVLSTTGALAQSTLPGTVDDFTADLNDAANRVGVDIRFVTAKCVTGKVTRNCNFTSTLGVKGLAKSVEGGNAVDNITFIHTTPGDPTAVILTMGLMVGLYAPDVDDETRGEAVETMLTSVLQDNQPGITTLNGIQFKLDYLGNAIAGYVEASE